MKEDYVVYVLDMQGEPLMPTKRFGKVRRMLRDKKAKVVQRKPFTIQLLYKPETHVVQEVVLGIDPGRTNIGVSCVREDGECLFSAEARTRNKDIPKLMQKRKIHRQQSRRGERLRRKRRAKAHKTLSTKNLKRVLPGYGEPIDEKHHIVPRSEGGMDTLENLAGLCSACHEAVHKDADTASVLKGKNLAPQKNMQGRRS